MLEISQYDTIAFDCDGIILDSNKVKTQAFYNSVLEFGEEVANALREYHINNGGISRYKKFEWLYETYLSSHNRDLILKKLLQSYATEVSIGLLKCRINPALAKMKLASRNASWMVVSGGAESEIRQIFDKRQLSDYFPNGVFGSPDTKDEIFTREIRKENISGRALFIGDSKYDYESSRRAGLDFVFVSEWTEVRDWRSFCEEKGINHVNSLSELI